MKSIQIAAICLPLMLTACFPIVCKEPDPQPCRQLDHYYEPVCGANGVTYQNKDEAKCAGVTDYRPGTCE